MKSNEIRVILEDVPARSTSPSLRPARADGTLTRARILDAAGRICAEKGFARTTSKEICARAGVNLAAVNYHFGSRDALYDEVLVEAHRQIVSLDDLEAIAARSGDPATKLRAIVSGIVARTMEAAAPWGVRVVVRELMAPTAHAKGFVRRAVVPKAKIIRGVVAEAIDMPVESAAVQRALAFVMVPAMAMAIAPEPLRREVMPALGEEREQFALDLVAYMQAGLAALRRRHERARLMPPIRARSARAAAVR